jgi:hypothetical protein
LTLHLAYRLSCRQETKILPLRSKAHLKNCIFPIDIFYVSIILPVISYNRDITLTRVARELAKCKLDLVGVLEVRLDKRGTVRAGDIIFPIEKETKIINWEKDFCTPTNSVSS